MITMRVRAVCVLAALLAAVSFTARAEDKPTGAPIHVDVSDSNAIASAMNKEVIVEGEVQSALWATNGKIMRIALKGTEKTRFQAVIFAKDRLKLDEKFGGDVAGKIAGQRVHITGTLVSYTSKTNPGDTRPEVVINSPEQLDLVAKTQQ